MKPLDKTREPELNGNHGPKEPLRRGLAERIFHKLAKFFNGIHWIVGITTLPAPATPREERSFVLMWVGIIVFLLVFFALMIYLLGSV
jgi:hypothetical protein